MTNDSSQPKEPDPAMIAAYQAGVRRVHGAIVIWLIVVALGALLDVAVGNIDVPLDQYRPVFTFVVLFTGLLVVGGFGWAAAFCPSCRAMIKAGGNLVFCPKCGVRLAPVQSETKNPALKALTAILMVVVLGPLLVLTVYLKAEQRQRIWAPQQQPPQPKFVVPAPINTPKWTALPIEDLKPIEFDANKPKHGAPKNVIGFQPDGTPVKPDIRPGVNPDDFPKVKEGYAVKRKFLEGHTGEYVRCVAFSRDGKTLASGSDDNTVKLWDVATGTAKATLTGHMDDVWDVAFWPDGKTLVSWSLDGTARVWDVVIAKQKSPPLRCFVPSEKGGQPAIAFSPDGKTVAVLEEESVKLLDVESGKERHRFKGRWRDLAFSSDGKRLALGAAKGVETRDVASGEPTTTFDKIAELGVFSPDDKTVAVTLDKPVGKETVKLFDVATGQLKATFVSPTQNFMSLAFSPDGKTLAIGRYLENIQLWDVDARRLLGEVPDSQLAVSVTFSPDGKILACGGINTADKGVVKLWDIPGAQDSAQKAAPAPPQPVHQPAPAVVAAWKKAGAEFGWMARNAQTIWVWRAAAEKPAPGDLPAFRFTEIPPGKIPSLPGVDMPFGLWLENVDESEIKLKDLARLKQLQALHLGRTLMEDADLQELAGLKELRWLILFRTDLKDTGLQKLAGLQDLEALDLSETLVTDAGLKELARLKKLQWLDVGGAAEGLTDAGLKELARLQQLRTLIVGNTGMTDAVLKELAALKELQSLHVSHSGVTGVGLKAFAELKQLHTLDLPQNNVGDAALKEIARLKQLRSLSLEATIITDAGLKELAGLNELRKLNLASTKVTDAGLKELRGLKQVEMLVLSGTKVMGKGLKELAALERLHHLELFDTEVGDADMQDLAGLKQLRHLNLDVTLVTDAGLKELAVLKELQSLNLGRTQVTDAGLKELAPLTQLQTLTLYETKVTGAGVRDLQKVLPRLKISR